MATRLGKFYSCLFPLDKGRVVGGGPSISPIKYRNIDRWISQILIYCPNINVDIWWESVLYCMASSFVLLKCVWERDPWRRTLLLSKTTSSRTDYTLHVPNPTPRTWRSTQWEEREESRKSKSHSSVTLPSCIRDSEGDGSEVFVGKKIVSTPNAVCMKITKVGTHSKGGLGGSYVPYLGSMVK